MVNSIFWIFDPGGRCTVGYLADETGYSRQHVHNRLNILLAAEYIRKIHDSTAVYELREDPRCPGGDT
jgi:DNA-binding MarR family transcriptional regulator